jgi:hypothetical protein
MNSTYLINNIIMYTAVNEYSWYVSYLIELFKTILIVFNEFMK